MKKIFLSAGIPERSDPDYGDADPLLIHSAVRSLCSLLLGHRQIVWGGHPAITPMMWAACENLGVEYAKTVLLYQSRQFDDVFPEENALFGNVVYVDRGANVAESLLAMRDAMMSNDFEVGVFIGGKGGIVDEFKMFRLRHPQATVVVLPSTGGAARKLGQDHPELSAPVEDFVDYMAYLAERIPIEVNGTP